MFLVQNPATQKKVPSGYDVHCTRQLFLPHPTYSMSEAQGKYNHINFKQCRNGDDIVVTVIVVVDFQVKVTGAKYFMETYF